MCTPCEYLECISSSDRKPMKVLQHRCDLLLFQHFFRNQVKQPNFNCSLLVDVDGTSQNHHWQRSSLLMTGDCTTILLYFLVVALFLLFGCLLWKTGSCGFPFSMAVQGRKSSPVDIWRKPETNSYSNSFLFVQEQNQWLACRDSPSPQGNWNLQWRECKLPGIWKKVSNEKDLMMNTYLS